MAPRRWLCAAAAAAVAPTATTIVAVKEHRWTICRSNHTEGHIPPSQWSEATRQQHCFLHRDDKAAAPGTALFQHWLSSEDGSWDPWNDFPTWDILQRYPDIGEGEEARGYYTLWYTTVVDPPVAPPLVGDDAVAAGRRGHLTLHGVNYRPTVHFDGALLQPYSTTPDDDKADAGGMFLRRSYDLGVRTATSSPAPLEILVQPPPNAGKPVPLNSTEVDGKYGLEEGQGGDHTIAKSGAIMQFAAGWDWIQSTPDRNVGIWGGVDVNWEWGDVRLHSVRVQVRNISVAGHSDEGAALPLGDDVTVQAWLEISVTATVHRQQNPIKGRFEYIVTHSPDVDDCNVLVRGTVHNVTIQQPPAVEYHLGTALLTKAKLWWPHTHSKSNRQPLYTLQAAFISDEDPGERLSLHEAKAETTFGVRTVSSFTHPSTKSFALKVNGHPIFLTGGNWITTDQFLRYSNAPRRYLQELGLLRHAGLNSIRVWGGGVAETEHFYNAADELGMLVYQEFWMTGDNNGRWAGSYDWPVDHSSYLANAKDAIKRLRNHPSLCWYGGGNELHPLPEEGKVSSVSPPVDIEEGLRRYIAELDGSRPYVTSSVTDASDASFDNFRVLAPKDGPYGILPEEAFFDRNPGLTTPLLSEEEIKRNIAPSDVQSKDSPGRNIGFQAEVGSASHPELESLQRLLSKEALHAYPNCGEKRVYGGSVHEEWTYFKYLSFTEESGVDHICQFRFPPHSLNSTGQRMDSIGEYSWAAQFAQCLQYKSLFEGYSHRMWEWFSAVYLWKASSPAPTLRGALYDWYLATNGGYWGARAGLAGGSPVRLVLNLKDWTVHVINTMPTAAPAKSVRWSAYSLKGALIDSGEIPIPGHEIGGNAFAHLEGSLPWVGESEVAISGTLVQNVVLYRLDLLYEDQDGLGTAKNSYFLTDPAKSDSGSRQSRYALLGAMRKESPSVQIDVSCNLSSSGISCTLRNGRNNDVAIMIRLTLERDSSDEDLRILPMLFSDNYFTLLPEETARVSATGIEPSEPQHFWRCSSDGFQLSVSDINDVDLVLSIDGWNVQTAKVKIDCNPSFSAAVVATA
ncbi:hypothetical protein ACHAXT_002949 [Thalassiosira profunda]